MTNIYDTLVERGIIAQCTNEEKAKELLGKEKVSFYIGFDPTADSLHIGHFVQIMVMAHMQRAGHRPIALVGGGTGKIGDPSGKTDMRKMLTEEDLQHNVDGLKAQLSKFLDFGEGKAIMVNNADWLLQLNYVEFLRDIGVHFSVNRMLSADCFKQRLEKGLNFIEFNYMLMQSYDFLKLSQDYNCIFQFGGDDQWSNIIAGVDLIRRVDQKEAYGVTFSLLTTSDGVKMGKTVKGAVWLDPEKTSPFELYQYLRNVDDADVINCLKLLTFVSMDEIKEMEKLEGSKINQAKIRLAYEVTKIVHGVGEAKKARDAAESLFGGAMDDSNIPSTIVNANDYPQIFTILDALVESGLAQSKGEARRLIKQGGVTVNDKKIGDFDYDFKEDDLKDEGVLIKKGKKSFHRVFVK